MKIKIVWGFVGNGALLGANANKIKAGEVFDEADDEYAHTLIGKGLAVELGANGKPKTGKPNASKPAAPAENKGAAAAPEDKVDAVPTGTASPTAGDLGNQADQSTGAGDK